MQSQYIKADFYVFELKFKEDHIQYNTLIIAHDEREIWHLLTHWKRKGSVIEIINLQKVHEQPINCISNGFIKMLYD